MDQDRYKEIEADHATKLTVKEMREGWHFSPSWDFMLVNMNDKEGEVSCCYCVPWSDNECDQFCKESAYL